MKKIAGAIISIGLSLSFLGCSWEVPQNISVKTNANYNFYLGKYETKLEDKLDIGKLTGDAGLNADIDAFDYFPGKKDASVQQIGLKVKLVEGNFKPVDDDQIDALDDNLFPYTVSGINQSDNTDMKFKPKDLLESLRSALGDSVADKLKFSKIDMYVYVTAGDLDIKKLGLTMNYGSKSLVLLDANEVYQKTQLPAFSTDETVTLDFDKLDKTNKVSVAELVETTSDNSLNVDYTVELNDMNFNSKQALKKADLVLNIDVILVISVEMEATADVVIKMEQLTGTSLGDDNGSGGDSSDDFLSKYLEAVESLSIRYTANSFPINCLNDKTKLYVNLLGDANDEHWHDIVLKGTDLSITLGADEIHSIKSLESFKPKVEIRMDTGAKFSLPREKNVDLDLGICLKTNGEISLSDN